MKYKENLINYIYSYQNNEPILIDEIKLYLEKMLSKLEYKKNIKNIYVYINRMVHNNEICWHSSGIYYKGMITREQVIEKKYIKDDNGIKGYLVGESLKYELRLTKTKPKITHLVSNVCYKGSRYINKTLNVIVHRPRIEVNNDNYRYLQLFNLIKLGISKEIIFNFIKDNKLELSKIYEYASLTRNKKVLEELYN